MESENRMLIALKGFRNCSDTEWLNDKMFADGTAEEEVDFIMRQVKKLAEVLELQECFEENSQTKKDSFGQVLKTLETIEDNSLDDLLYKNQQEIEPLLSHIEKFNAVVSQFLDQKLSQMVA